MLNDMLIPYYCLMECGNTAKDLPARFDTVVSFEGRIVLKKQLVSPKGVQVRKTPAQRNSALLLIMLSLFSLPH